MIAFIITEPYSYIVAILLIVFIIATILKSEDIDTLKKEKLEMYLEHSFGMNLDGATVICTYHHSAQTNSSVCVEVIRSLLLAKTWPAHELPRLHELLMSHKVFGLTWKNHTPEQTPE